MKTVSVDVFPFVSMKGTLDVPDDVSDTEEYIKEHFNDIRFSEPNFDFAGADIDIYEE